MWSRLIALLLALCVCWSGLATHESAVASVLGADTAGSADGAPAPVDAGSVEAHHLDDIPAQTLFGDLPALLGSGLGPKRPPADDCGPVDRAARPLAQRAPEVPLRPPR